MTDMQDRIERAARAIYEDERRADKEVGWPTAMPPWDEQPDKSYWMDDARMVLLAAFPELFDTPTHWIAPMVATGEMSLAALEAVAEVWPKLPHFQGDFERGFVAMRTAYLNQKDSEG